MIRLGVGKTTITPPLPVQLAGHKGERSAVAIADDLFSRAIILEEGQEKIILISVDLLWLDRDQCLTIKSKISGLIGIQCEHIMIVCTHAHSGPDTLNWYPFAPDIDPQWLAVLFDTICSSAYIANQNIEPTNACFSQALVPIGVNRRLNVNGVIERLPNPNGPVDHTLSALSFLNPDGKLLACLLHHSTHPVILGADSLVISGDWCGIACNRIEEKTSAICLYLNGASGNVNPIVGVGESYAKAVKVGEEIARAATKLMTQNAEFYPVSGPISITSKVLSLASFPHPYLTRAQTARLNREGSMVVEIQALKIGGLIIIGMPGEILVETARAIIGELESPKVLVVSGANDYVGYLPLSPIINEGGYEARTRMLTEAGIVTCVDEAIKLIYKHIH